MEVQPGAGPKPAVEKKQEVPDPQVWYEMKGRAVFENLIADLNSRGYNSLTIKENGDICIQQADNEVVKQSLKNFPCRGSWQQLVKVFEQGKHCSNCDRGRGRPVLVMGRRESQRRSDMIESRVDPRGMGSRGRSPEYGKGRLYDAGFPSGSRSLCAQYFLHLMNHNGTDQVEPLEIGAVAHRQLGLFRNPCQILQPDDGRSACTAGP